MVKFFEFVAALVLTVGTISSFFAALNLVLIAILYARGYFVLKKGFQFLVLMMTVFELVFALGETGKINCSETSPCGGLREFFATFSGFAASGIADVIVCSVAYTFMYQIHVPFEIMKQITAVIVVCGFILGVLGAYYTDHSAAKFSVYYWAYCNIRVVEICISIVAVAWSWYYINRESHHIKKQGALATLVTRLVWYPISMTISRIPISAYTYLHETHPHRPSKASELNALSTTDRTIVILSVLFTPTAAVFDFFIFLQMQPSAHAHLMHYVSRLFPFAFPHTYPLPLAAGSRVTTRIVDIIPSAEASNHDEETQSSSGSNRNKQSNGKRSSLFKLYENVHDYELVESYLALSARLRQGEKVEETDVEASEPVRSESEGRTNSEDGVSMVVGNPLANPVGSSLVATSSGKRPSSTRQPADRKHETEGEKGAENERARRSSAVENVPSEVTSEADKDETSRPAIASSAAPE